MSFKIIFDLTRYLSADKRESFLDSFSSLQSKAYMKGIRRDVDLRTILQWNSNYHLEFAND